jgi:recombination protein RecA
MLLAQPSCGEEGFNIALDLINTGEIDLVIIDSDSSLIPRKILDGEVGDSNIGRKAKLNSDTYPKMKTALARNNTCAIIVSQYREKIGVMFGNPTTTQGGHALKYGADVRIEVTKSAAKDGDFQYGNVTKIKSTKNKMSPPYRLTQFEVVYGEGIDRIGEILVLSNEFEILRKYGKTITYNENKYDIDEFRTLLEDNEEFFNKLREDIINKINQTELTTEDVEEEEVQEEEKSETLNLFE